MKNNESKNFFFLSYSILNICWGIFLTVVIIYPIFTFWTLLKYNWINAQLVYLLERFGVFLPSFYTTKGLDIYLWGFSNYWLLGKTVHFLRFELLCGAIFYIITIFKSVMKNSLVGEPFKNENIMNIKKIGWIIIVIPLIILVIDTLYVLFIPLFHEFIFTKDSNLLLRIISAIVHWLYYCGVGFILIGISEVFKAGTLLKQENDLTV